MCNFLRNCSFANVSSNLVFPDLNSRVFPTFCSSPGILTMHWRPPAILPCPDMQNVISDMKTLADFYLSAASSQLEHFHGCQGGRAVLGQHYLTPLISLGSSSQSVRDNLQQYSMPRDWTKWNPPQSPQSQMEDDKNQNNQHQLSHSRQSKQILHSREDCEALFCSGSGSRSSFTSVDSGFSSSEDCEDFREELETLNAEKLETWIRSVSDRRNSFSDKTAEICQPCDGEILLKVCPYGNIEDYGRYDWEGSLDSEGKLHGRGLLSLPDGGTMRGVWRHGVR